jgi:CheY-like chemotaxis protein
MGASEITTNNKSETWKVLIADDYPETNSVIECALLDLIVLDRRLEYIHAYSEQNACQLINDNPDIVLVLVNVEMDSETAGLNVVKYIRDTLCRQDIRIVLRTDQLEYSIEESVIKDYDINDYQTKADLTRRKLMTTVYTAIRSFQQIFAVNENRRGLEKIISASSEVIELGSIQDYAQGVLTEFIQLFDDDLVSGLFCSKGSGLVDAVGDLSFDILGQIGFSSVLSNEKLDNLKNQQASQLITKCFQDKKNQFTDNDIALYFTRGEYQAALYFKINSQLSETNKQLIEVFLNSLHMYF